MKVLQIVISPPLVNGVNSITGPERRAARLAPRWKNDNIDVTVCYPDRGRLIDNFKNAGLKVIDFEIGNKFNVASIFALIRIIKSNSIELIHCQGPASLDLIAVLAAFLSRRKIIITRPVMLFDQSHYSPLKKFVYSFIDKMVTLKLANGIIAVSQTGYDALKLVYKVHPLKLKLIYNGIQTDKFKVERIPKDTSVNIGMVAQLFKPKGWFDFIKCIELLNGKTTVPVTAYIIGEGEMRDELENDVKQRNIKNIIFAGYRENVYEFLKELDIFLFTSHREGLSVAIIEALAAGLPIISTNVGGAGEQITDGENGYLFATGDVEGMSAACARLINNPDLRVAMSKRSETIAKEKFSEERMYNAHVHFYKDILNFS